MIYYRLNPWSSTAYSRIISAAAQKGNISWITRYNLADNPAEWRFFVKSEDDAKRLESLAASTGVTTLLRFAPKTATPSSAIAAESPTPTTPGQSVPVKSGPGPLTWLAALGTAAALLFL